MFCFNTDRYYGQGNITEDNFAQFIKHDILGSQYLNQSKNFLNQNYRDMYVEINEREFYEVWQRARKQVLDREIREGGDNEEALRSVLNGNKSSGIWGGQH